MEAYKDLSDGEKLMERVIQESLFVSHDNHCIHDGEKITFKDWKIERKMHLEFPKERERGQKICKSNRMSNFLKIDLKVPSLLASTLCDAFM